MKFSYGIRYLQCLVFFAAPAFASELAAQEAPTVGTLNVQVIDVSPRHEFVGRVEAVNSVDIRSRIEGFIEERLFNEGQVVEKDQDLFLIDPRALEIALADAKAALASAEATAADARRRLARNESLSSQTVSRAVLEESQAAREAADAGVLSAKARVSQAELNLSYARISSPLQGRIGAAALSVGNFVNAASPPLARVVEMDPIRVVFSVSDRTVLDLRLAAGRISKDELAARFKPKLSLSGGELYEHPGQIEFFGNEIDERTGTLSVRTLFPNPDQLLTPGQFATVVISEAEPKLRPVVPLGSVQQDREGKYVLLVGENDQVAASRITVSDQVAGNWVVEEGLKGAEVLIVEGLQNASPGETVKAVPAAPSDVNAGAVLPSPQPGN
jgi:membrane fusion protein (multidrug efflux system)